VHARKSQLHSKEKSRELQRKLYLAAKKSRTRRFHALYDRLYRPDILWRAWCEVKANGGTAGVDGVSIKAVEEQGVPEYLEQIGQELKEGIYCALPVRRVYIPKPDGQKRPLGIPTVKDRIVQQACKIIIEPIFEANFQDCSYGFRPRRNAHQAVNQIDRTLVRGWWILDADIQGYYDHIDHGLLLQLVKRRISDRRMLKLIRKWLKSGVLEEGRYHRTLMGTPQGGVISPLLANIYLHVLDMLWTQGYGHLGKFVRYADDFVVICRSQSQAVMARKAIEGIMKRLKQTLHPKKTKLINLNLQGFDFLGFHFHKGRSWRSGKLVPFMWPSQKAMNSVRTKIRKFTGRNMLAIDPKDIIRGLNVIIRGWRQYFQIGNSTRKLQSLDWYVNRRLRSMSWKRMGRNGKNTRQWIVQWVNSCGIELFYTKRLSGQTL